LGDKQQLRICRVELPQYKCVSTPIFIGAGATTADSPGRPGLQLVT